ncbi:MAG TPA: 3-hydroxybutyrate dehydrogenase, partial [Actinomycetales bacterium]|nr:3-hydroxybutyrate dehydrogenase [Actinomycetales bacterium]
MTDPTNPVSPTGAPALDLGGRRALVTGGAS